MKAKRILLRADGGAALGLGHLMRCRTLALEMRRQGWEPLFYSVVEPPPGPLLDQTGHPLPRMPVDPAMHADPGQGPDTMRVAREWRADVVVVDHYGFRSEDFQALTDAGFPVVALDDLGNRELPVDMVVNPNPLVTPTLYKWQAIPVVLTGEMYTLIRPEILNVPRRAGYHAEGSLFVSLGGGDVAELTLKVLHALPLDLPYPVVVAVSRACPRLLLDIWAGTDPSRRGMNVDPAGFPDLLGQGSLAVTGGGTTLWELYYVGIPGIVLIWVANQKQTAAVVRRRKTSLVLEVQEGFKPEAFREAFLRLQSDADLREGMVTRQQELIDGQGARRLAEAICQRYER